MKLWHAKNKNAVRQIRKSLKEHLQKKLQTTIYTLFKQKSVMESKEPADSPMIKRALREGRMMKTNKQIYK